MSLSANFFCMPGKIGASMVSAWLDAGHRALSVVVGQPEPLQGKRWKALAERGIRVVGTPYPVDWAHITRTLGLDTEPADVLICYAFMRKIPQTVLRAHRNGGVNFHPSLLPHYHGPHPTSCLVAERAIAQHGGVSLHVMTDDYDAGDLLAQARMLPADFGSHRRYVESLSQHICQLTGSAIPAYCSGRLTPEPQHGTGKAAHRKPTVVDIHPQEWSADEIQAACALLSPQTRRLLHATPVAPGLPILAVLRRRPAGARHTARIGLWSIDTDCADAHITLLRDNLAGRILRRLLPRHRP